MDFILSKIDGFFKSSTWQRIQPEADLDPLKVLSFVYYVISVPFVVALAGDLATGSRSHLGCVLLGRTDVAQCGSPVQQGQTEGRTSGSRDPAGLLRPA